MHRIFLSVCRFGLRRCKATQILFSIRADEVDANMQGYVRLHNGQWWTPEWNSDSGAYDQWKDDYRAAYANYEAACAVRDQYEAARWKQIFDKLYEPRRRNRIAHVVRSRD
jgi:hypothetical protein